MHRYIRLGAACGLLALLQTEATRAAPYLLAVRPASGTVVALDLESHEPPIELDAGGLPASVAADGNSGSFVSSDGTGDRLFVSRGGQVESWATAEGPAGVAFCAGGSLLASVAAGSGLLELFSVASGERLAALTLGRVPLALDCDDQFAVVSGFGEDRAWIVDLESHAVRPVAVGAFPAGVAIARGRAWIANLGDDTVSVVSLATAELVATLPAGIAPRAVAAGGDRVYVADWNSPTIAVFDAQAVAPLAVWNLPGEAAFDLAWMAPDRLYASHPSATVVSVLDAANGSWLADLPAPVGLTELGGAVAALGSPPVEIPALGAWGVALLGLALGAAALRTLGRFRSTVVIAALASAARLSAGSVSWSDSTFDDSDWTIASAEVGNGGQTAGMSTLDGDPPPARRMSHDIAAGAGGPEVVEVVHRFLAGSYDPGAQGAIGGIDASWKRIILAADGVSEVSESFVLFQNGVAYRTAPASFFEPTWTAVARSGLTAQSFVDADGLHPDFTTAGAPISFGYSRRSASAGAFAAFVAHGIDDFSVLLETSSNSTTFAMADRLYLASGSDSAELCALRQGDGAGSAAVEMRVGLGIDPDDVLPLGWGDGETGRRCASYSAAGFGGAILRYRVQLANPSPAPGAVIDPERSRALLLYTSDAGLAGVLALLSVLLAGFGPPALCALALAALVAACRRAGRANQAPSAAPAREA